MTPPRRIWIDWKRANEGFVAYDEAPNSPYSECHDEYFSAALFNHVEAERDQARVWIGKAKSLTERLTDTITRAEAAEAERDALRAEVARLRGGRNYLSLALLPPDSAPKGVPVLVAGGIAMKKTGGEWFSGMCEPAFSRPIIWDVQWWAVIPQQNTPLATGDA